ncbi:MAG: S-layer homology domain-containing protein [Clostridia bacterium]|nr:S-layer homology domain-containing protein [Clostridia bacterium]MBN2883605.1 S-layer homology domain-containing protein [Clostridia bacterium]
MNKKKRIGIRIVSIGLVLIFMLAFSGITGLAGEDQPPVAPTEAQEEVINEAADFLEEMDMEDMAENVRQWLEDDKIKIDPDMSANGSTTRTGLIRLRRNFVAPLPKDELERFKRVADLAQLLLHEKTHAHQAPEGGAMSEGVSEGDWDASFDVMSECIGPDALEVEAYYKQIRAYLLWAEKVDEEAIPEGLSEQEQTAAQTLKEAKKAWLIAQAARWARILKVHNFEKATENEDIEYLADQFAEIDGNSELTEAQKLQQKIDILNNLIDNLFEDGSFYDWAREEYEAKRGEEEATDAIPAEAGSMDVLTIEFPGGGGHLIIEGLPENLDVGLAEMLTVSIYDFLVPPEPDPGYAIVSPVYEIVWNSLVPIPFTITFEMEGIGGHSLRIGAFAMNRTDINHDWEFLPTEIITEGEISLVSASSDAGTMFAVMSPVLSFIDMPEDHWAFEATARLDAGNILDGGVILMPAMEVPRELFVMYMVKALGLDLIEDLVPFEDVDPENPYFTYISTAYHNGLTTGVEPDRFGLGEIIPREQSITFLIRAIGMEEEALAMGEDEMWGHIDSFFDIFTDCSEWAYPYLAQAKKVLLAEGYPDGSMKGKALLSHAEVIVLIDRIMTHVAYNGR